MATMNDYQRDDLLEDFALAIKNKDRLKFDELTQKGIVYFSEEQIQRCLNEELPLKLTNIDIQTLLKYMVNDDEDSYIELVKSLLAEMIRVLEKEGYEFGKDFSYKNDGLPSLNIRNCFLPEVKKLYKDFAWRQCSPFIKFTE